MGRIHMQKMRNVHKILVEKPLKRKVKRPIGIIRSRRKKILGLLEE